MKHIKFDTIASTQKYLQDNLVELSKNHGFNLLVSTKAQTEGVGRRGNHWIDTGNALAFSMALEPHVKKTLSSLEMGVLLCEYFFEKYKIHLSIKWPNDLLLNKSSKVAGILCQIVNERLIVGMGINFGTKLTPDKLEHNRYQLGQLGDFHLDQEEFHTIAEEIFTYILENRIVKENEVAAKFKNYCSHLNNKVLIKDGDVENIGTFTGIGIWGEALLENAGQTHHIYNGSLTILD